MSSPSPSTGPGIWRVILDLGCDGQLRHGRHGIGHAVVYLSANERTEAGELAQSAARRAWEGFYGVSAEAVRVTSRTRVRDDTQAQLGSPAVISLEMYLSFGVRFAAQR